VRTGPSFDPVFHVPVNKHLSLLHYAYGILSISKRGVHWQEANGSESFDAPLASLRVERFKLLVDNSGQKFEFFSSVDGGIAANVNKDLGRFYDDLGKSISTANATFTQMSGGTLPETAPAIDDAFRTQAAQWRALPTKPELPEEARKQRVLGESYLREKDFPGAIEHYELGVKAYPTWPEGWFNLALLYGETGSYAQASDRMKHYLELMPDSPDAPSARDKIVIWDDKAAHAH
jgi:tetratricopeptide (TPR) repeat protein